jgi:hypothetical protein
VRKKTKVTGCILLSYYKASCVTAFYMCAKIEKGRKLCAHYAYIRYEACFFHNNYKTLQGILWFSGSKGEFLGKNMYNLFLTRR